MWVREAERAALETFLNHTKAMMLVSSLDGKIFWANEAFCLFIGYTLGELKDIGWRNISASEGLSADEAEAIVMATDGYVHTYTVQKQYIPKNSKPQWGILSVMRYPSTGEVQFCLCTWEPLKNGTAEAFTMAMEHVRKNQLEFSKLAESVDKLRSTDADEDWLIRTIRIMKRYPKTTMIIVGAMLSVLGANNLLELIQRITSVSK